MLMKPNKYFKTWKNTNSLYLHLAGVLSNVTCKQKATSANCKSANLDLDSVHLFIYIYNMLNNWNELCWISISKNRQSKADHMVFGPFSSSSLGWGWFILKTDIFSPQLPSCRPLMCFSHLFTERFYDGEGGVVLLFPFYLAQLRQCW